MRVLPIVALVALASCSATPVPKAPDSIPPELIPPGYTAADCRIEKPAEAETEGGPGDSKYSTGSRAPQVRCTKTTDGPLIVSRTAVCHTRHGKELPPADCCLTATGEAIPECTPKPQPVEN